MENQQKLKKGHQERHNGAVAKQNTVDSRGHNLIRDMEGEA